MPVLLKVGLVLLLFVYLLNRRVNIGSTMFAGALVLYLLSAPTPVMAATAVTHTLTRVGTWQVIITMILVMCLEYLLRTSGIFEGFMSSVRRLFGSDRILLAVMPALLGFLPSLGGALFSAPMVGNASSGLSLSGEHKAAINYWFRHIWEFSNPIVPALLLASEITGISLAELIKHLAIYTLIAGVLGWAVLLRGEQFNIETKTTDSKNQRTWAPGERAETYRFLLLGAGPIFINLILVILFKLNPALSMGLVVIGMILIVGFRPKDIGKMLWDSLNVKLIWGILAIFLFQQVLVETGTVSQLVDLLKASGVPVIIMISSLTFLVGLLTGQMQSFVGITFPLVNVISPGSISVVTAGYVLGTAGSMLSPAHLCLVVSLEYFKAGLLKSLSSIVLMESIILCSVILINLIF